MKKNVFWSIGWLLLSLSAFGGALSRPAAIGPRDIGLGGDPDDPLLFGNLASSVFLDESYFVVGSEIMVPRFRFTSPSGRRMKSSRRIHPLPYLIYARPINDMCSFKINISTPFGLGSAFDDNIQQLGYDTESLISLTTVVPSLSLRVSDSLAIGIGGSIGWSQFKYKAPFDVWRLPLPIGTSSQADGFGFGAGAGILYHRGDRFAVGLNYASTIKATLSGRTKIRMGPFSIRDKFDSAFTFPDRFDVAVAWKPTPDGRLLLSADYNFFGYSKTPDKMKLDFEKLPLVKSNTLNWRDHYSAHFGTSYKISDAITVRGGVGYMSKSIPKKTISTLTMDVPGWSLGVGGTYYLGDSFSVDAGITRGWGSTKVNRGIMRGKYSADIYTCSIVGNFLF